LKRERCKGIGAGYRQVPRSKSTWGKIKAELLARVSIYKTGRSIYELFLTDSANLPLVKMNGENYQSGTEASNPVERTVFGTDKSNAYPDSHTALRYM